ncbi:MAG TPA: hypothetical protein PLU54_06240 [Deltaproteobacteria bacterium]|nr:hypothetical protein [Deltaproteobacteria bacterium]
MKPSYLWILTLLALLAWLPPAAQADISVEGGLTYEKTSRPGEQYQGVIMLKNQAEAPREIKIYQTDYRFDCEGKTTYGEPGTTPRSNARWMTFSPGRVIIPPKEKASITYTIAVPADESLRGTYWSMLMVEVIPEKSPEASGPEKTRQPSLGIIQVMRYAVQIITHVGDTGSREVKFLQTKVSRENGARILQVDVENTGERLVRPQVWTELFGGDGASLGRFPGEQYRLYPGTSRRFSIDITSIPAGTYKTLVVADCGADDLFGITYTLKLEH